MKICKSCNVNKPEKKLRIFKDQEEKCNICHNSTWNGKPITLELDHINGNRLDDSRKNLQLICPNCHSQTPTYKVGNNKGRGKKIYSDEEIIEALKNNVSGYKAMVSLGMNPHGENYKRVRRIIQEYKLTLDYSV